MCHPERSEGPGRACGAPPDPPRSLANARDDEVSVIWNIGPSLPVETDAMEKPVRPNLLPGVSDARTPPAVVFQSRKVIAKARRRAAARDVLDLLLLFCVDGLFLRWPMAHVPGLDRADSLLLLAAINVMLIGYIWVVRALPRWTARRVAATWCVAEQSRMFNALER